MTVPLLLLFAALLALAVCERIPRLRYAALPLLRPFFRTDLVCLVTGALALGLAVRALGLELVGRWGSALPALGVLPAFVALPTALVLYDLLSYLCHYAFHRFEALWRFHKVHHSSLRLDWLATFRAHVFEHALRHVASSAALLGLGFSPSAVGIVAAAYAAWGALNHANLNLDLRALEAVLITPRLHRFHHVTRTTKHNLGTILSIWDRWRGTLVTEGDPEPLGLPAERASYPQTYVAQFFAPLRKRQDVRAAESDVVDARS
jgi:sterol desaturase/sphingolipid hydroxylase (fatty acid hydroxylase superfamily)